MSRQAAERRGRRAETIAAWWLRLKGYRILGRRVRTPAGEIDIVARRFNVLAFVEVKARKSLAAADDALDPRQLKRVGRAANLLYGRYGENIASVRIDAVIITAGRLPKHIVAIHDGEWT